MVELKNNNSRLWYNNTELAELPEDYRGGWVEPAIAYINKCLAKFPDTADALEAVEQWMLVKRFSYAKQHLINMILDEIADYTVQFNKNEGHWTNRHQEPVDWPIACE